MITAMRLYEPPTWVKEHSKETGEFLYIEFDTYNEQGLSYVMAFTFSPSEVKQLKDFFLDLNVNL